MNLRLGALAVGVTMVLGRVSGHAQAPATPAASPPDLKTLLFKASDALGILRGLQQEDSLTTLEFWARGTMTVGTHAYRVSSYRGSLRFHAVPSMRVDITRTGPDGAQERVVEAVAGPFGWNETEPGVNGSPAPDTAADRMLFLRTLPPGFLKGAGRPHDPVYSQDVNWNGDAIGSWDGDTLVVDVVGFNAESWLGWPGWFHSNNMHVIERLTREGSNLRYEVRVEDPDVLLEPWNMTPRTVRLNPNPKAFLMEDPPCVERDFSHMTSRERG